MWLESHQSLANHPKTRRLARLLGVGVPTAIGHLHLLWYWALDYAPDGALRAYDERDLADACQWEGDPDTLIDGLRDAGWLDVDSDGQLTLHDWADYGGRACIRRVRDAERKRKPKAVRADSAGVPAEIPTLPPATGQDRTVPDTTGPDTPAPTSPDRASPRAATAAERDPDWLRVFDMAAFPKLRPTRTDMAYLADRGYSARLNLVGEAIKARDHYARTPSRLTFGKLLDWFDRSDATLGHPAAAAAPLAFRRAVTPVLDTSVLRAVPSIRAC